MPILKHAKKKLRQDKKRTIKNKKIKDTFKSLVKKAKETKSPEALSRAFSAVDKAAKKNILNKNKAARMKSSLTKQVASGKPAHSASSGQAIVAPKTTTKKTAPAKSAKPAPARNASHSDAGGAKASKSSGAKKKPASKK